MPDIEKLRAAVRGEGLSGWFFYNMAHRDAIADLVLEVPADRSNSRPWAWLFLVDRPPVKIVHRIEAGILRHLPGETILYYTREELTRALASVLPRSGKLAADFSSTVPVSSFLDHGTALFLESLGATLVSAENLVAEYLGRVDEAGQRSQEAAAAVLLSAVHGAWARLSEEVRAGRAVREGDLQDWVVGSVTGAGLPCEPPITGTGRHTNDPHFAVEGRGELVRPGDVIQFDLWARARAEGSIYADISWIGVCAAAPTAEQEAVFDAVTAAREAALSFLSESLAAGRAVRGAEVDRAARAALAGRGFAERVRHRTGHSIGGRVHGFGVNLDSVEFPDERPLREGACFSIEPGIYLEGFGMRTEIDCCIRGGRAVVTSGERQRALLVVG
jgi:Xaa-Pro dipeptidase